MTFVVAAGVRVEDHVLQGWPHGFGAGNGQWIQDFDQWATMDFESNLPTGIEGHARLNVSQMYCSVRMGFLCLSLLFMAGCAPQGVATDAVLIGQTPTPGAARSDNAQEAGSESPSEDDKPLATSSTIRDVVNHPAFVGFGHFVLPLDRGRYDEDMPLESVASLLPYHSNVDPDAVVDTINFLIDTAASGETTFHDFYTDAQKRADPTKESTGLFFFRGEPGAPFAVISPGGGFSYVGSVHEGFPHAFALRQEGYNAFVLQYRVGGEQVAVEDLAAALSWIFSNAETLGVSTEGYAVWGSSAGARMAARIGSYGAAAYGGDAIPHPRTVVMAYTGHADFTESAPPTFAIVGERDGIASPATMQRRVDLLRSAGIDVEFHVYPNVGHGFGLGSGTTAEGWFEDAVRFWEAHMSASS